MAKRIEATNVTSYYGSFKAIDSVSMTVEPKTITALIGPSGCGKSTFLRSINRMHEVLPGARIEGKLSRTGSAGPARVSPAASSSASASPARSRSSRRSC